MSIAIEIKAAKRSFELLLQQVEEECHGQATMSFIPTRTSAFSGISGISGIRGSRASEDYISRHDLESSEVLSCDLEVR